jgi:hypothetical protein
MVRDSRDICGRPPARVTARQRSPSTALCCSGTGSTLPSGTVLCQLGYLCPTLYSQAVGKGCHGVQTCSGRQECATAYCANGVCLRCAADGDCGRDGRGACTCSNGTCRGTLVVKAGTYDTACPAGTVSCTQTVSPADGTPVAVCYPHCGGKAGWGVSGSRAGWRRCRGDPPRKPPTSAERQGLRYCPYAPAVSSFSLTGREPGAPWELFPLRPRRFRVRCRCSSRVGWEAHMTSQSR